MKIPFNNIGLDYPRSGEAFAYPEEMEFVMKTKKICSALLSLALSAAVMLPVCGVNVSADVIADGTCGDNLTWTLDDNDVLTISGQGAMTNFSRNSMPWELYISSIKSVVIQNGVTSIGENAFNSHSALESVSLSESITNIGSNSFYGCGSLTSLMIPEGVKRIESYAFANCENITNVVLPSTITYIGAEAFWCCTSVDEVICYANPDNLEWDEESCDDFKAKSAGKPVTTCKVQAEYCDAYNDKFAGKVNVNFVGFNVSKANGTCGDDLTWELDNSNVLTITGTGKMYDYTASSAPTWDQYKTDIVKVIINSGANSIGNNAFNGCTSLVCIDIPEGVESIGDSAFQDCTGLTAIELPTSVSSIGNSAFSGCSQLEEITIPEGVVNIDSNAFLGCGSLTTFSIPSTVTNIGADAFKGCTSVTEFVCKAAPTLNWTDSGCDDFQAGKATKCKVVDAAAFNAKFAKGDSTDINVTFEEYILGSGQCGDNATWLLKGNGVLTISGTGAMTDYESQSAWYDYRDQITGIVIENGITSIGNHAFSNCYKPKTITIPGSVQRIGAGAFSNCGFTSISIPDGVKTIENQAFYYCEYLTTLTMSDSVTTIGEEAFYSCYRLETVYLSNKLTSIGLKAFYGANNVADIYLNADPTKLTWIWDNDYSNDHFKDNRETVCHVPENALPFYNSKFSDVNVTFQGDLDDITYLAGNSITLADQIGVNFFVGLEDTIDPADVTVSFTWGSGIDATTQESYVHNVTGTLTAVQDPSTHGGAEYVATCSVAARAMTDTVTMEIKNGNTVIMTGECRVVDYADALAKQTGNLNNMTEIKIHRLLKAMLNYGAESQNYFGYRTDDLANAPKYLSSIQEPGGFTDLPTVSEYIAAQKVAAQDYVDLYANLDIKNIGTDRPELGIKYNSMSVICTSQTKVRLYFQVSDASKHDDLVIKDINNNTLDISLRKNATSLYYVEISGITPARLYGGMLITINGTEYKFYYEDYMGKCVVLDNKFADTAVALGAYSYFADKYVYGG